LAVALGDGRLTLEREPGQQFDLLVMDAFSGDSAPVHLITREAFEIYFRHLKPRGLLAVNITNTYLDLLERARGLFR
jgi:spermidine synthase